MSVYLADPAANSSKDVAVYTHLRGTQTDAFNNETLDSQPQFEQILLDNLFSSLLQLSDVPACIYVAAPQVVSPAAGQVDTEPPRQFRSID